MVISGENPITSIILNVVLTKMATKGGEHLIQGVKIGY